MTRRLSDALRMILIVALAGTVLAHQLSLQDLPQTEKVQATTSPTSLTSPRLDLTNMELHQVINRGRYAELWKGSLEGVPVVFKLYPSGGCRCYDNESAVYGLALLRHPSIALFLGEGESGQSGERVLVLELAQHGSLRAFLSQHCSDWAGTVRLALSLCQGLSFLHSEIHRDGVYKPAVAHRDLSSNNVLVKADRTCALSDFGSATSLNLRPGPRPLRTQEVPEPCFSSEPCSPITCIMHTVARLVCVQVGTPRYMPPEILDGTLNIRDPLSSLRQVDVYSLGLLVWEMTTRCTDLWTVSPVPEYRPAYEAELGPSPSLDELVLLVSERRKRPALTHLSLGTTLASPPPRPVPLIHRDGVYKPAVAHRDLSSNNVLVKADRTCALSDFGSATALNLRPGPRPLRTQEVPEPCFSSEPCSPITCIMHTVARLVCVQVGTPRYMPPEILDGTLNIRDPLSSLRQVDVYSLGLLVWEMTTRCTDLWTVYSEWKVQERLDSCWEKLILLFLPFPVSPVPEYRPAYEAELGPSPSLDELVLLVSERRKRPALTHLSLGTTLASPPPRPVPLVIPLKGLLSEQSEV
ncbi:UNVERIFIED_CONTAM: hypothetical protein FKN15_031056 [Acipenser sinensis]